LSATNLCAEDFNYLTEGLRKNKHLIELNLSNNRLWGEKAGICIA